MNEARLSLRRPGHWPLLAGLALLWLLARLPRRLWAPLSLALGALLRALVPGRRRVVLRNLELAFPERDEAWRRCLCRDSYRALALSLLETAKLWFSDPRWLDDYVRIEGGEQLERLRRTGTPVILLSCHYTAIEVAGAALCRAHPFHPVYAAAKNPAFDDFQRRQRLRFAPGVVAAGDMRRAMRVLREGGVLWMLPDHAVAPYRGGVATRFFGQPVLSSAGPGRLQQRSAARCAFFALERRADGGLKLTLEVPEVMDEEGDQQARAQRLNDRFEAMIRRAPSDYFWHHKRFKSGLPGVDPYAR